MRLGTPDSSWAGKFRLLATGLVAIGLDSAVFRSLNVDADSLALAQIAGFFAATTAGCRLVTGYQAGQDG